MHSKITSTVIIIVAVVWALNFTAPLVITDYKPAPELNIAFMAIIGVLTAKGGKKDVDTDKDKDGANDAST